MEESEVTMTNIEATVRSEFDIHLAELKLCVGSKSRLLESESQLRGATDIFVENVQIGFSKVKTMEEALRMCGEGTTVEPAARELLQHKKPIERNNEKLMHALATIKKLEDVLPVSIVCEATRRVYIDPVLVAAARISKDITMEVERGIAAPKANGPVDYVFNYQDTIICVTEGYYNDQDKGVFQNIAQLSAVRHCRKRKYDELSGADPDACVYGIATTFLIWQFTALENKKVKVSPLINIGVGTTHLDDDVKLVVEMIPGLLERAKSRDKSI